MKYKKTVLKKDEGERLDKVLPLYFPNLSRSYTQYLIKENKVTVNGIGTKASLKVRDSDEIQLEINEKKEYLATKRKFKKIFEDKDILAIDKPAGITIHPNKSLKTRDEITILDMLLSQYPNIKRIDDSRPGIVHRLDKNTSGLLLIAKNKNSADYLKKQFKERKIKKVYTALLMGRVEPRQGTIEAPIGRNPKDKSKMAVTPSNEGRQAITKYEVLEYLSQKKEFYTLIHAFPETGRTHQIRVHFSSIGHPIIGDKTYGPKRIQTKIDRPFLHASMIGFTTLSGKHKKLESKLPPDLRNFLNSFKKTKKPSF